ncbi:hypothetical protein [Peribacillus muralis]
MLKLVVETFELESEKQAARIMAVGGAGSVIALGVFFLYGVAAMLTR